MYARPSQLPPRGEWATWLIMAGRGFGKTRTGAEWVRWKVETGQASRIALVGPTVADARDVMVKGESGILAISNPDLRPVYEPSKRLLTWPNGAIATTYSAEKADRLRGPQHDCAWVDELAAWRYLEAYDMLDLGLRLGTDPQCCITTTPKPIGLLHALMENPRTKFTGGSTYENKANMSPLLFERVTARYEGTRIGEQELHGKLLRDFPGAYWTRDMIQGVRMKGKVPEMIKVVVAVDPAMSATERSDETGIVVAGLGRDKRYYVLADLSCRQSPSGWATLAVKAYHDWNADRIVAEVNQGGDLVEETLRRVDGGRDVSYRAIHASKGKTLRAEPISALYEQGKVSHSQIFGTLEDQMCALTPDGYGLEGSPDRLDAMVYALTFLSRRKYLGKGEVIRPDFM